MEAKREPQIGEVWVAKDWPDGALKITARDGDRIKYRWTRPNTLPGTGPVSWILAQFDLEAPAPIQATVEPAGRFPPQLTGDVTTVGAPQVQREAVTIARGVYTGYPSANLLERGPGIASAKLPPAREPWVCPVDDFDLLPDAQEGWRK